MVIVHSRANWFAIKRHCRISAALLAFILPLMFTIYLIRVASANPEVFSASIIVCPDGPPTCDYTTIQAGIDAAEAGDTVLVGSGVYTENLSLRSDIRIESVDGPESVVVTALKGPIITGTAVSSVVLQGLGISGRETIFTTTGIELRDSEVTLSDMIVSDFTGFPGHEFSPDGKDASGIRATGTVSLAILNSRVQNIAAGDGWSGGDTAAVGGDAAGIWVGGEGQVSIVSVIVDSLTGGAAGSYQSWGYGCDGSGGSAVGIHVEGGADLNVTDSQVFSLHGGWPCYAENEKCESGAGGSVGIETQQGIVSLSSNLISDLELVPSWGGEPGYGIHSTGSEGTYLDHNTIEGGARTSHTAQQLIPDQQASPWCSQPGTDVTAIASEGDLLLQMTSNTIRGFAVGGTGGQSTGLLVQDVSLVYLSHNTIEDLGGGYGGLTATGAHIIDSSVVEIEANSISNLSGSSGPQYVYYLSGGFDGGSAVGIYLENVPSARVFNNKIASLTGGDGGRPGVPSFGGRDGGNAVAIDLSGSLAQIMNNTVVNTVGGAGGQGEPPGSPGIAAGLVASTGSAVEAFNNALTHHGVGMLSVDSALLSSNYNDFWMNESDYDGVLPGTRDLHVSPAWAGAQFHLSSNSALIDAGTNQGAPDKDYDADPRPVDGNGDAVAITDIGADEFCLGICFANKSATPHIISVGDSITYEITIMNASLTPVGGDLYLSDNLSTLTQYVQGSLSASSGNAAYENGTVTWTGSITAGSSVSIVFQVSTDPLMEGSYVVPNEAVLTDGADLHWYMRSVVLVDPQQLRLPLLSTNDRTDFIS